MARLCQPHVCAARLAFEPTANTTMPGTGPRVAVRWHARGHQKDVSERGGLSVKDQRLQQGSVRSQGRLPPAGSNFWRAGHGSIGCEAWAQPRWTAEGHAPIVSSAERRHARGTRDGWKLLRELGDEIREARVASGLSQSALGRACGVSHTHIGRLERGEVAGASVLILCRVLSILGLRMSARAFPAGAPLRDAAHAALLERLRRRLPAGTILRTEVPLDDQSDLRAWDATVEGLGRPVRVEAETRIRDLQAVDRRIALKMADDASDRVILLLSDTRSNRLAVGMYRSLLRSRYPLTGRAVLEALGAGRAPAGNGVLLL